MYYYDLIIEKIVYVNNRYYIKTIDDNYILKKVDGNANLLNYIQELENSLIKYKYFFSVVFNKSGFPISMINNDYYMLLETKDEFDGNICIFDIKNTYYVDNYNLINRLNHFDWISLWEKKIDYYENWLLTKKEQFIDMLPLFNYYIGIGEMAIAFLKMALKEKNNFNDSLVFMHNRVKMDTKVSDYYDPTLLIVDHKSRDIAEYIKDMFYNNMLDYDMIRNYFTKNYFSDVDKKILYSRILFPTFFFDNIEQSCDSNKKSYIENVTLNHFNFLIEIKKILNI